MLVYSCIIIHKIVVIKFHFKASIRVCKDYDMFGQYSPVVINSVIVTKSPWLATYQHLCNTVTNYVWL